MATDNPYITSSGPTTEEMIRQWWQQRFGTVLPEDVKTWLRSLIRQEISRSRVEANLLDDKTLQLVREGRRLQQTKLSNVEESLQRIRIQQERTQRYIELASELEQHRKRLYELNKQQASVMTQQKELERFEAFEAINGRFQRILTLTQGINLARQLSSQLAIQIEDSKKQDDDAVKKLEGEREELKDCLGNLIQAALTMAQAERLTEQVNQHQAAKAESEEIAKSLREILVQLQKRLQEVQTENERLNLELSNLKLAKQSLDAHQVMITKSEAILIMLDELLNAMNIRDGLSAELNQAIHRQNERDEQLRQLFQEHQKITASIQARQEEVDGHRRNIAGQESFNLQRRALELRSRKLMLETGFSLWRNIASGYNHMEEKAQRLSSLRLNADHLNRTIDTLEAEVAKLEMQYQQKIYHWTLSKSQNVIELRTDLQEGTPCTVCGATHHPWRGEGIKEQHAIISSLKSDCDTLERELANKRNQLQEMRQELTATMAKLDVENANYQMLQTRQKQDTDEWQYFTSLDRSFVECSQSTNRDARTAIMKQLIDKTTVDAEEAEKELKAFTFHLDAISRLGAEIHQLQQDSDTIVTRLNEVNTACQVMAGQVERLGQRLATATRNFSQRYETIEREITIQEWFQEWKKSPESIKIRIQEMTQRWQNISDSIQQHESDIHAGEAETTLLVKSIKELLTNILKVEARSNNSEELASKAENTLQKLLPGIDGKTVFQNSKSQLMHQYETLLSDEGKYKSMFEDHLSLRMQRKHLDNMILQDEQRVSDERKELDLWMRKYNANNPPVQFVELERVLADGKDWTDIRRSVREIILETAITQARVDHLRAQIIALQAEGVHPDSNHFDQEQLSLSTQQEELEKQRREILKQIANLDEKLRAHEQALTFSEEFKS